MHNHAHLHHGDAATFLPLVIVSAAASLYWLATLSQWANRRTWSPWRVASFFLGSALLIVAFSPGIMMWAHHDFKVHMAQHLVIGMVAPIAYMMAAPMTLMFRYLPPAASRKITRILRHGAVRLFTHPVTALVLNIGGMGLLYFTPLFRDMNHSTVLHWVIHIHFFLAGYLYSWAIAGPDHAPGRPSYPLRLLVLFAGTALHANISKWMYGFHFPRGTGYTAEQIEAGARLMYYGGDATELVLAIILFSSWYRQGHQIQPLNHYSAAWSCSPIIVLTVCRIQFSSFGNSS